MSDPGTELIAHFDTAQREFGRRVSEVAAADGAGSAGPWSAPTPCEEWDVRTLVNHIVNEMLWAPPLLAGRTIAEVGDRFDGDVLGADPRSAWEAAAAEALAAVRTPGSLDSTVHLSFGDNPGHEYVWQLTSDLTIHAWDLARGAGQDDTLPAPLVTAVLGRVEPAAEQLAASGVFGTPVEVPFGADDQTRLLGLVGRRR